MAKKKIGGFYEVVNLLQETEELFIKSSSYFNEKEEILTDEARDMVLENLHKMEKLVKGQGASVKPKPLVSIGYGDLPCQANKCPFELIFTTWDCRECSMKKCSGECESCESVCMAKINGR